MPNSEQIVYRPPVEAANMVLEVSIGCSYGKCSFCQYTADHTPLQLIPQSEMGQHLLELSISGNQNPDLFLAGGNVLAFKASYLLNLFSFIRTYLPNIQHFRMYARADDILHKTKEELGTLALAGLDILYIGLESGNDQVLAECCKGETRQQMLDALHRLDAVGIAYGLSSIIGLGGRALWKEHTADTASFYNQVRPASIRLMTLTAFEHSPLQESITNGTFQMMDPSELLQEELLLVKNLHPLSDRCLLAGTHVSNSVPLLGYLPEDHEKLVHSLEQAMASPQNPPTIAASKEIW